MKSPIITGYTRFPGTLGYLEPYRDLKRRGPAKQVAQQTGSDMQALLSSAEARRYQDRR